MGPGDHDILDGPDAEVRVELSGVGALFTVLKKGDSVTVSFPDGKADVSTSIAGLKTDLAKAEVTGCKSNLKNIATALEMWSTDNAGRYPKKMSSLTPNYLKTIPLCPRAYSDTYSASYKCKANPDFYRLSCQGEHHKAGGLPKDFPQYTSEVGIVSEP